uniref:Alpha N-terminal protein methyltransferase 1 n=1 Tax=Onchocerca volvulus TaxID=6282 RepID=A0A8R1TQX6_ONCVO
MIGRNAVIGKSVWKKRKILENIQNKMNSTLDQKTSNADPDDKEMIYEKAKAYWASVSCNVNGMLGGFAHLHVPDIHASKHFINLLKAKGMLTKSERAVDCGCGIGRVTKHLLLPLFDLVDMVDVTESFIQESTNYIGEENSRIGNKFVCSLQQFEPSSCHYDLIWIQWVTGHLTNDDFCKFLQRCKESLKENGVIVLKENVSSSEDGYDFDEEDNSWTRPKNALLQLFRNAGLTLMAEKKQQNFPKGMLPVYMFGLR